MFGYVEILKWHHTFASHQEVGKTMFLLIACIARFLTRRDVVVQAWLKQACQKRDRGICCGPSVARHFHHFHPLSLVSTSGMKVYCMKVYYMLMLDFKSSVRNIHGRFCDARNARTHDRNLC